MKDIGRYSFFQALVLFFLLNSCTMQHDAQSPAMERHKGFGRDLEEQVQEGWQKSDLGFIGIGLYNTITRHQERGLAKDGGYIVFTDTDSESPPPPYN